MSVDPHPQNVDGPLQIVRNGRNQMQYLEGSHDVGLDYTADAAITTGDLCELTSNGVQPHSTDGEYVARPLVAIDSREFGMEAGDSYESGQSVRLVAAHGGGLWMRIADGESVTIGSPRLVSNGNGTLRGYDGAGGDSPSDTVCVAVQPVNNSSGSPMWVPVAFS
jgi:hypothetical protein